MTSPLVLTIADFGPWVPWSIAKMYLEEFSVSDIFNINVVNVNKDYLNK